MIPEIRSQVTSNSQLTLSLNLKNVGQETLLFRPTLEDWVIDNQIIIASVKTIDLLFTCLPSQQAIKQTLIIEIPDNLQPGQVLKNWLRFPSVQEMAIPLHLEVISPSNQAQKRSNCFVSLSIDLPIITENSNTDPIFNLMSAIIDLDKIPSRWLVAELCTKLYQIGESYRQSSQGYQLLNQLKSTNFLSNGITAFSSTKIPQWIRESINIINKTLSYQVGESSLLYIWECWLFSLEETNHTVPKSATDDYISQIGISSEKWFSNIILGLAKLLPTIKTRLFEIKPSKNSLLTVNQANITLSSLLSGLELIPVRWLAVEILVSIAYLGETSLELEEEKKLLSLLSSSSFFNKGILAFTSAQVARWMDINYSAISAYYHSLGLKNSNYGLLTLTETWLWNLSPNPSQTISINQSKDLDILIKELGMDEKRWFIAIIFGLKQLSPRIGQTLQNIAQQTEHLTNETTAFTQNQKDVIEESGSMQR